MLFPFILLGIIVFVSLVHYGFSKFILHKEVDIRFSETRAATFLFHTVVNCYTLLVSGAVSPFVCIVQNDGTANMIKNPSELCYSGTEWKSHFPTMVLALITYLILLPIGLTIFFLFNRRNLDGAKVFDFLHPLTSVYKPRYFWWEVVALLSRAAFVVISSLIPAYPEDSAPYFGSFFIILSSLSLEFFVMPFKRLIMAKISALWSLLICVVLMTDGLIFKSSLDRNSKTACSVLMLLLILFAIGTIGWTIFKTLTKKDKNISPHVSLPEVSGQEGVLEFSDREQLSNIAGELEVITGLSFKEIDCVILKRSNRAELKEAQVIEQSAFLAAHEPSVSKKGGSIAMF
jgi:hypothetical protein